MTVRHWTTRQIAALNRRARTAQAGEPFVPGCSGKRGYASATEARGRDWTVYRCRHCKRWHRSTKPGR